MNSTHLTEDEIATLTVAASALDDHDRPYLAMRIRGIITAHSELALCGEQAAFHGDLMTCNLPQGHTQMHLGTMDYSSRAATWSYGNQ